MVWLHRIPEPPAILLIRLQESKESPLEFSLDGGA